MGHHVFLGAQSWFAKNTACRSLAPPRQAAGRVFVSCSWSVTRSHLCLWLGAARACSFSSCELSLRQRVVSLSPLPRLPKTLPALSRTPWGGGCGWPCSRVSALRWEHRGGEGEPVASESPCSSGVLLSLGAEGLFLACWDPKPRSIKSPGCPWVTSLATLCPFGLARGGRGPW